MECRTPLVAIVDDEEAIRTALLRLFRFSHFRAEAFASCKEFLEFLPDNDPDCIVLDMRLPGMTGIELLRHLSEIECSALTIVITGDVEHRTRDECMALGTKYYFSKPLDGKELLATVSRIVDQKC